MGIVSLAQYRDKCDWSDQEIAEFQRVCDTLRQAGFAVETDRGLTDEGDPWFVFLREGSDEVIAHFARIDGQVVADSSALPEPLHGRDLRAVLDQTFRQYTLLPARGASGSNLFLHPAALLTAFVATAFLHLEHGKQALALSREETPATPATPAGAADGATGAAGPDKAAAETKGEDGVKALLARLPALFGQGHTPANAPARAVSVNDQVSTLDTGTTHSVILTTLVAALGVFQSVDLAAAQEVRAAGDEGMALPDAEPVPIVYTAAWDAHAPDRGPETGARLHASDARAVSLDAAAADPGGVGDGPDGMAAATESDPDRPDPLDLELATSVPITLADDGTDARHRDSAPAPTEAQAAAPESGGADGGASGDEAASGSDGASGSGGSPEPEEILKPSDQANRQPDGGSGGAAAQPSVDQLLFGAHDGAEPALSGVREFIDAGQRDPIPIDPVRYGQFDGVSRAFGLDAPGEADFVLFEGESVPYLGFAYRPEVIFVKRSAISDWNADAVDDSERTTIDLAGGGELTLVGVVQIAEDGA